MTSATERLREMLDARGVEYETDDKAGFMETSWRGCTAFQLSPSAKMTMIVTPEQAIAATLGSGECEVVGSYYYDDYDQYEHEFSCGHSVNMYDKEPPNYCPNCGRKVKQ